jgi:beta-lactamase regulating signal transducer with metallopeptidase domain
MVDSPVTNDVLLLDALWQTTAWLGAGLVLAAVLQRHPARAHGVLLVCVFGAVFTPVLSVLFRVQGWGLLAPLSPTLLGPPEPPPELAAFRIMTGAVFPTWPQVAGAAWLGLSAMAVARLIVSAWRGRRLLASAEPVAAAREHRLARAAADRLGVRRVPELLVSNDIACPVIWCWGRRPRLLLPTGARPNDEELLGVLCHELAHTKRRDHWASLAAELALCLLPWHPLAWVAHRRLRDLGEEACDAWVLAAGESPTTYAEALLGLLPQTRPVMALASVNGRSPLARRIVHILKRPPGDPRSGRPWMTVTAALAVLLVTTAALAHRRAAPPEPIADRGAPPPVAIVPDPSVDIVVIPSELDLDTGEPGEPRSDRVWLVNTGTSSRRVTGVKTSCGCTTVTGFEPATLAPGEFMMIEVTMTAPTTIGEAKTKQVIFHVQGQPPLKLPVHLKAVGPNA